MAISAATAGGLAAFGNGMAVAGMVTRTIGAYYGAISQRYQLRSQASTLEFQGSIADINARSAEIDAANVLVAGRSEKARLTLRHGQIRSENRARTAASGVELGVGSAAEVDASFEAAKEIDALTIDRNSFRALGAARQRAVDFRNQATLARASASGARLTAGSINPFLSAFTSFAGGAGRVASSFLSQTSRSTR